MHELTDTDGLVLHQRPAWHGLGTVVDDAPTPTQALALAGLDWHVDKLPLFAAGPDSPIEVPGHVAVVRRDTAAPLGVVKDRYRPVQNRELAEFAEALAEAGDTVTVESAGSIRGGRRVWFLLRGESFSVRDDDHMTPYILLSNGHDGTAALRATPTTVRVVCSNTLHMVIPGSGRRPAQPAELVLRHTGDVAAKVHQAKAALHLYERAHDATAGLARTLAARDVTRAEVQRFWLDVYQTIQAPVPADPRTQGQRNAASRARDAMASMAARFDRERDAAGANAWNALNAFTGWMQHDRPVQGRTDAHRRDNRTHNRLFGSAVRDTGRALHLAAEAFA